jgi:putative membrane protein
MSTAAVLLTSLVAAEHVAFFALESLLWRRVAGPVFGVRRQDIETTRVFASNQGLYNLLLALALGGGLLHPDPAASEALRLYGLAAVILAGLWGGATVHPRVALVQAAPAAVGLALTLAG